MSIHKKTIQIAAAAVSAAALLSGCALGVAGGRVPHGRGPASYSSSSSQPLGGSSYQQNQSSNGQSQFFAAPQIRTGGS